jgi:hypothetical protein
MNSNQSNQALKSLFELVTMRYVYNVQNYPRLKGKSSLEIKDFGIKHSLLHIVKGTGRISQVLEDTDHGAILDTEALKAQAAKLLVNTLKLAETLGMTADELIHKSKNALSSPA